MVKKLVSNLRIDAEKLERMKELAQSKCITLSALWNEAADSILLQEPDIRSNRLKQLNDEMNERAKEIEILNAQENKSQLDQEWRIDKDKYYQIKDQNEADKFFKYLIDKWPDKKQELNFTVKIVKNTQREN